MAPLFVYILVVAGCPLEYVWRVALGFGSIPPLLLAYSRYKRHFDNPHHQPAAPATPIGDDSKHVPISADENTSLTTAKYPLPESRWELVGRHKWTLVGTALSWLLLDITFYANGLFKETVVVILGLAGGSTPSEKVANTGISAFLFHSTTSDWH